MSVQNDDRYPILTKLISDTNELYENVQASLLSGEFKGEKGDKGDSGLNGLEVRVGEMQIYCDLDGSFAETITYNTPFPNNTLFIGYEYLTTSQLNEFGTSTTFNTITQNKNGFSFQALGNISGSLNETTLKLRYFAIGN